MASSVLVQIFILRWRGELNRFVWWHKGGCGIRWVWHNHKGGCGIKICTP